MKERPIIFNGDMVRAILSGRKSQTRRVIANVGADNCIPLQKQTKTKDGIYTYVMDAPMYGLCPFGQVGDRLWVRETFAGHYLDDDQIQDIKDGRCKAKDLCEYRSDYGDDADCADGWTPSIHMPRWASRILLEITAVRVERLNDISESDARAEGYPVEREVDGGAHDPWLWFRDLWDGIYPDNSFKVNPWVWVIEFKRVEAQHG